MYNGIAKDDYVMAVKGTYAPKGETTYTKLDTVSGTITGVRDTNGAGANDESRSTVNGTPRKFPPL